MPNYLIQLKALVHATAIGRSGWLDRTVSGLIDFLAGPITGINTRYYWVFLAQSALLLAIVHIWRGGSLRGFARFCAPAGTLRHPSTVVDIQLNLANQVFGRSFRIFWRLSTPAVAASFAAGLAILCGPSPHLLQWNTAALLCLTVLVMIADDLGYYLFHRAAHTVPVLWAFHKVHHSAEVLTPLVAGRVHPVEVALSEPVRSVAAALVLGPALYLSGEPVNLVTVFGIGLMPLVFGALGNQLLHSQVPISWGPRVDRIIVSPAVHQVHHSAAPHHWNRNLGGLLSVWDWMFGTLHLPEVGETLRFGIAEGVAQIHPNVVAAYLVPFRELLPLSLTRRARRIPVRV